MVRKRLPRPAPFATVNYPTVPCGNRSTHCMHDYRAQSVSHGAEDGWYHCCGVARGTCEPGEHS